MKKFLVVMILMTTTLVLASPASARPTLAAGRALEHASRIETIAQPAQASCPAGVPVQTITVVNQANVHPVALAKVERAVVDQSLQLRAAWGTPCVTFGPAGWVVTLQAGTPIQNAGGSTSLPLAGHHDYTGVPSAVVTTGRNPMSVWSRAFTHEIVEMLVDPTDTMRWKLGLLEVCDPVENWTYPLDGVQVSDFVLPAYFTSGPGPWDEAGMLAGPFS
jgi:hypothetical protein